MFPRGRAPVFFFVILLAVGAIVGIAAALKWGPFAPQTFLSNTLIFNYVDGSSDEVTSQQAVVQGGVIRTDKNLAVTSITCKVFGTLDTTGVGGVSLSGLTWSIVGSAKIDGAIVGTFISSAPSSMSNGQKTQISTLTISEPTLSQKVPLDYTTHTLAFDCSAVMMFKEPGTGVDKSVSGQSLSSVTLKNAGYPVSLSVSMETS